MKEKILKYLMFVAGFISLFAFILVRFNSVPDELKVRNIARFGDLYKMNYIAHFDELIPPSTGKFAVGTKQAGVNDADILVFGDSFFDYDKCVNIPELIADSMYVKVHFENEPHVVASLTRAGFRKGRVKQIVFEIAERGIPELFAQKTDSKNKIDLDLNLNNVILDKVYDPEAEVRYSVLLEKSIFTYWIHKQICTLKFNLFGFIPTSTPVYAIDPPFLFYESTVSSQPGGFYHSYTDKEVSEIANNIANFRDELRDKFNLELIFVVVPNKYSIYHTVVNNHAYNDFIPMLNRELHKKSIICPDIYSRFMSETSLLYYPTDTHWNKLGIDIAFEEIRKYLK